MKVYVITVITEGGKLLRQEAFFSYAIALEMYRRAVKLHTEPLVTLNTTNMSFGALGAVVHEFVERTRILGIGPTIGLFRGILGHWAQKKAGQIDGP